LIVDLLLNYDVFSMFLHNMAGAIKRFDRRSIYFDKHEVGNI